MIDVYRSPAGRADVAEWCTEALADWPLGHTTRTLVVRPANDTIAETGAKRVLPRGYDDDIETFVVGDTEHPPRVLIVPDAGLAAAMLEPAAAALASLGPVWVVDQPGDPGLSSPLRPRRGSAPWLAAWLDAVLAESGTDDVVLVGVGAGALAVIGARHPSVRGRLLVGPAGIVPFRSGPRMARDTARWLMRATPTTSLGVARHLVAGEPGQGLVGWLTVCGKSCRSQAAPRPLPRPELERALSAPVRVVVGDNDVYLSDTTLAAALARRDSRDTRAVDVDVIPGAGHVPGAEHWGRIATVARELRTEVERTP